MAISCRIDVLAETKREPTGYFYDHPQSVGVSQQQPNQQQFTQDLRPTNQQQFTQDLRPPPSQQQSYTINSYSHNGQVNVPTNNIQNTANYALQPEQQQLTRNHPALNFELPTEPQLSNVNYSPPRQFNSIAANDNNVRLQFNVLNDNQGNNIEQGRILEPIVGQFKPELVDLANGGPLTRMITTCGPNNDCKTIALQADLNRALAVLPQITQNNPQRLEQNRGYNIVQENAAKVLIADLHNSLVRPSNRRLFEYSEILRDDIYN